MNKRILKGTLTAIAALMSAHAFAGQEVTVYTAFETDLLAKYKSAFEKENPDIEIKWVRDSTGIMTANCWLKKTTHVQKWCGDWLDLQWLSSKIKEC